MPLHQTKSVRYKGRGRGLDWGFLKREWDKLVPQLAPITSKLIGPVATALTGVPIPNPGDLLDRNPEAVAQVKELFRDVKTSRGSGKPKQKTTSDDVATLLLDMGLRQRGKGFDKY